MRRAGHDRNRMIVCLGGGGAVLRLVDAVSTWKRPTTPPTETIQTHSVSPAPGGRKTEVKRMATKVKTGTLVPRVARPGRLKRLSDVREELGKLYRDARTGDIDAATATKLGYLLNILRAVISDEQFESRLNVLEKLMEERKR